MVGLDKYRHHAADTFLCPKFLSAMCGIVADEHFQLACVMHHPFETATRADGLFVDCQNSADA